MAVRRLLIVMLILLGVSTLAAALVPTREDRNDGTESTIGSTAGETDTQAATDTVPIGKELSLHIKVGDGPVQVVPMELGDTLTLVVSSTLRDTLEIPALGLVEAVGPDLPARFQVFGREVTDYGIRYVNANRVVARIEVQEPGATKPAKPHSKQKDKG